jgi:tetratricopeptide (TPR) repeat protein
LDTNHDGREESMMDRRKLPALALGLLAAVGGCTTTTGLLRNDTKTEARKPTEEMTHKASTYVAFGDFRAAASFAPEHNQAQQLQFREDAKRSYQKALEVDPNYLPAHVALARLLQACEDHPGAVECYKKALEIDSQDPALWFEMGMCEGRAKKWEPAVTAVKKACELDPANRQYSTTLGLTLARAGRFDESFAALCRHNGEAKAHCDLARMLRHMKQTDLARQHAQLALNKDPSMTAARSLLTDLESKPPEGAIKTVSCSEPADGQAQAAPIVSSAGREGRPIRVPPLPVITTRSGTQ